MYSYILVRVYFRLLISLYCHELNKAQRLIYSILYFVLFSFEHSTVFAELQLIQMRERIGVLFKEDDYTAVVVNNDAEYLEMRPYCALMDIDLDAPDGGGASSSPSPTSSAPPPPPPPTTEPKSRGRARVRSTLFGNDSSKVLI